MNKTDIEWCDFTWNPVTGCKNNCHYCYAKKIHQRFNKTSFRDIVFHRDRLYDKMPSRPSRIFVGSMSDCQFWTSKQWDNILDVCNNNPDHTFMFLSKSILSYSLEMPKNCMQGLTVTSIAESTLEKIDTLLYQDRPFLSIEPLLGTVARDAALHCESLELVIVGAMTVNGRVKQAPDPQWVESAKQNIRAKDICIKNSIKPFWFKKGK